MSLEVRRGVARCPPLSVFVIFPGSGRRSTMATGGNGGGKGAMETGFALSEIDTTMPHPARMYDALLGGCFL